MNAINCKVFKLSGKIKAYLCKNVSICSGWTMKYKYGFNRPDIFLILFVSVTFVIFKIKIGSKLDFVFFYYDHMALRMLARS